MVTATQIGNQFDALRFQLPVLLLLRLVPLMHRARIVTLCAQKGSRVRSAAWEQLALAICNLCGHLWGGATAPRVVVRVARPDPFLPTRGLFAYQRSVAPSIPAQL
jgi:hypothetical protein